MKLLYLTTGSHQYSYETDKNFYETFIELGINVVPFNYIALMVKHGRESMNKMLLKCFKKVEPDIVFSVLFRDEIKKETIKQLSSSSTITINWFCDDHWRFDTYTKYWAPLFHYSITTWEGALKKYKEINYDNVIYSQWAANPKYYKPYDVPKDYEVTFIGAKYGPRPFIVKQLKKSGIKIECFGKGWAKHEKLAKVKTALYFFRKEFYDVFKSRFWEFGLDFRRWLRYYNGFIQSGGGIIWDKVLSAEEMIKMYSRSLINLNFGSSSFDNKIKQIKARNFEIPMAGGFLITDYIPELKKYYKFNEEIVVFNSVKELIEKIKYYLDNRDELERIRQRGYKRSLRDHTYKKRFLDIFKKINIKI